MCASKLRPRLTAKVRKDAIARAALPVFARNGLHGVTTRELAKACGVSEALIFRHFPTKEALFNQMLHQYSDLIMPRGEHVDELPPPSTGTLVQLVFTFVRRVIIREPKKGRDMLHFFYRSYTEDGKFARQFLRGVRNIREGFERSLLAARESGDALPLATEPYNLFWFVQHIATAACMMRLPENPPVRYRGTIESAVDDMVLFVLRGMGVTDAALRKYATPEAFSGWRQQSG